MRWGCQMHNPKKYLRAAFRVATTNLRLGFGKIVHGSSLKYHPITCLALSDGIDLSASSMINFGSGLRTRGRCSFNVQGTGKLSFGDGVFLNSGCQFNCRLSITVGDNCEFGPNVLVYDHDHIFRGGFLLTGNSLVMTSKLALIAGSGLEPSFLRAPISATAASLPQAAWSRATSPMVLSTCRNAKRACLKLSRLI